MTKRPKPRRIFRGDILLAALVVALWPTQCVSAAPASEPTPTSATADVAKRYARAVLEVLLL